ncbi:MAG TPA: CHAT domain-containing protein [Burkholderiales bacterium]|jgi:CHAT domain-containing protein|nr:CHAT domain-containing protein [Burkholderiales bacterium]HEX2648776.1 CHAT domain-containing protein [Burkholderiales bacterium]
MVSARRTGVLRALLAGILAACCASTLAQAPAPQDPAQAPLIEAQSLAREAAELQLLGFRRQAIERLERAASLTAGRPDARPIAAGVLGALGQAYLKAGQSEQALPKLQEALELARAERQPALMAAALNDMGQLYGATARRAEAMTAYRESMTRAGEASSPLTFAAAATNAALLAAPTDPSAAAALLDQAGARLEAAGDAREADFARIRAAQVWRSLQLPNADPRSLERPHALLTRALRSAEARDDALATSYAAGRLGELYGVAGRGEEALGLTRRAVRAAQRARADESLYLWSWQAARLLASRGEREAALAAYRRALESLHAVRQDMILELRATHRSWRAEVGPLFLEYAELLLRREAGQGVAQSRLREARDVVEQLKAVELEDYFQDNCVAAQLATQKGIDQMAPRTAVLYPILLPERLELLVGLEDGIHQVTLPVAAAALSEDAHGLRRRLEKRTTSEYLPFSRRLYASLFQPIEALLAEHKVETLVFVPDGALRGVPLGALYDGKRYLVERFAFATAPGLTLVDPRPLSEKGEAQVLLSGLTESVQNFPALPFVAEELKGLQAIFAGGRQLRDRDFSVPGFKQELRGKSYSIVHIASHGEFDSDPRKSFLLTWDGRLDMDGLEAVMKQVRFRDEPVELLTLSACRTAAGDDRASLGLAGVAVKAGARSVLATLWYVNDQASSLLVNDFYRQLREGSASKAKALQAAQRAVLSDRRFRHPGYWAPFLLIGNWL